MTTWSKTAPKEPGWYWITEPDIPGSAQVAYFTGKEFEFVGTAATRVPVQLCTDGVEFGPRITFPDTLARVAEFLGDAGLDGWPTAFHTMRDRARELLAELESK